MSPPAARVLRRGRQLGVVGSTGLAVARENGRGRRGDHEHRGARLAGHALALLPRAGGAPRGGTSTWGHVRDVRRDQRRCLLRFESCRGPDAKASSRIHVLRSRDHLADCGERPVN